MSNLPPSPSPLRPVKQIIRRRYQPFQLAEALKLAKSDGVAYASSQTNVAASTIYKLLKPAARKVKPAAPPRAKPESPEKLLLRLPQWSKIKALALYYHANVPNDSLRNAFTRAAIKIGVDYKTVWRAFKAEKYSQ